MKQIKTENSTACGSRKGKGFALTTIQRDKSWKEIGVGNITFASVSPCPKVQDPVHFAEWYVWPNLISSNSLKSI